MTLTRIAQIVLCAIAFAFTSLAEPQTSALDVCEVHDLKMSRKRVEIRYGLPGPRHMEFLQAAQTQFPHSGMPLEGGCVVSDTSTRSAEVFVCPRCHSEAVAWLEQHKEEQHVPSSKP